MDLLGHKLVALFIIFFTIFISTALPIIVSKWFRRLGHVGQTIISAVMCFGGGFFLGTLLLHNLPEVVFLIDEFIAGPCNVQFPVSYFIVGCGFFLMLMVEKAVMELVKWNDRRKARAKDFQKVDVIGISCNTIVDHQSTTEWVALRSLDGVLNHAEADQGDGVIQKDIKVSRNGKTTNAIEVIHRYSCSEQGHVDGKQEDSQSKQRHSHSKQGHSHSEQGHTHNEQEHSHSEQGHSHSKQGHSHSEQGHTHSEQGHSHVSGSAAKSIVLLLALSIDCIFEGLSLGLQMTIHGVWQMLLAILSHELVVAFGLGLQLTKHNSWRKVLAMSIVYGIMCPAGIVTGFIFNSSAANRPDFFVIQGILLGITGGVFLYVTFFEILMHEFVNEVKLINLLAVLLGYSIMAVIVAFGHGHSDGNDPIDELFIDNNTVGLPCLF